MEKTVELTIDAIYKEKFEKDVKGYNPDQVDAFLDRIIRDYDAYESQLAAYREEIVSSKKEIQHLNNLMINATSGDINLKKEFRRLELENSVMKKKLDSIKPGDAPNAENMAYIQRINELENFLYQEGYDPKSLKKRNN